MCSYKPMKISKMYGDRNGAREIGGRMSTENTASDVSIHAVIRSDCTAAAAAAAAPDGGGCCYATSYSSARQWRCAASTNARRCPRSSYHIHSGRALVTCLFHVAFSVIFSSYLSIYSLFHSCTKQIKAQTYKKANVPTVRHRGGAQYKLGVTIYRCLQIVLPSTWWTAASVRLTFPVVSVCGQPTGVVKVVL